MIEIICQSAEVNFPVFNAQSRGLINTLFRYGKARNKRIETAGLRGLEVHALCDINLHISAGDRVALIGRNGAGKTTLLRLLSGAYEPTAGSVSMQGRVSSLTDPMLGMDLDASGYENIVTKAIVMGLSKNEGLALVPEVEKFTELGDYLNLPLRAYSSGMMLRLAFGVSTAHITDILLMDEMIGAGDASFMQKAKARINQLIKNSQILVLASHNDAILRDFCNRGLLLSEGRILFEGSVDECLEKHHRILTCG